MLGGSVSGLLSLAAEKGQGGVRGTLSSLWCPELWQALSCRGGDPGWGPDAVSGIQKVLNKLVLDRGRPGPWPRESHCLGGAKVSEACGVTMAESLLFVFSCSSVKWDQSLSWGGS